MHFETTYQLEEFILNTQWKDVPEEVKQRMKGCFVDLMGALVIGSRSGSGQQGHQCHRSQQQTQQALKLFHIGIPPLWNNFHTIMVIQITV